jgi:crotonobetainyl-CoA:carnitine CoA-transferase CaiB-like acyl-CoA transferase
VTLLGSPDWATVPALADSLERSRQGPAINAKIRAWAKDRKVADIVREGQKLGVPLARYNTPADVLADRHERERGLFQPVDLDGVMVDMLVAPFQFGKGPLVLRGGPPVLGEAA